MKEHVLIADDEEMIRELLCTTLGKEGYCCHQAGNAEEGIAILKIIPIDIAFFDIMMPGRSGLDLLKEAKKIDPELGVLMITEEEWELTKQHPRVGYEILAGINYFKGAAELVLCHHERYDGNGYPGGLKGKVIPISARIFALVDTLDAMTSDRPYRKALPFAAVIEEVIRLKEIQFDPELVDVFLGIEQKRWEQAAGKCLT